MAGRGLRLKGRGLQFYAFGSCGCRSAQIPIEALGRQQAHESDERHSQPYAHDRGELPCHAAILGRVPSRPHGK